MFGSVILPQVSTTIALTKAQAANTKKKVRKGSMMVKMAALMAMGLQGPTPMPRLNIYGKMYLTLQRGGRS